MRLSCKHTYPAGKIMANSFSTGDILIDDNFITTT